MHLIRPPATQQSFSEDDDAPVRLSASMNAAEALRLLQPPTPEEVDAASYEISSDRRCFVPGCRPMGVRRG
ncbi:MAG: hypothetical protein NZ699_01050 [Roseiflexus sp.]|nr:hypothetical protein [Roseiflexus sp.]MCS7287698.1 hypothetical protein [Roseiflexus sp.]MDW8147897.1 hypothetical protein [Roseiflexaceae bacterium]